MDFDTMIDRLHTDSIKCNMKEANMPEDVIPLWVADMDFLAPEPVIKALRNRVNHGIYGYSRFSASYYEAVIRWMKDRHDWEVKRDWILVMPGVIPAINVAIQAFTNKGDGVLIQQPVYHPFRQAVLNNGRKLVNSPLILEGNRYRMNLEDVEKKIISENVKLFILCSPHNPVGRVWSKQELMDVADICIKHDVLIVVDEIHHDIVYPQFTHTVLASLGEPYQNHTITCTAPTKTFNLAGLQVANIIIPNESLRRTFRHHLMSLGFPPTNLFGRIACEVAYREGGAWLDALLRYLDKNRRFVQDYLMTNLTPIQLVEPEATYLLWLDFRNLGLSHEDLERFLVYEAKLWLNQGKMFGDEGEGFFRMNIATPKKRLQDALYQLKKALDRLMR